MKTMRITNAEVKIIEEHRQSIKHEKATQKFRKEIFELAYQFNNWLDEQGEYPSFSGFINCFNPSHSSQNKLKYDCVIKVLDAVNSLQLSRESASC
ncbi:hypothetical protein [Acinetobacter sp. CFCC 10889]|uniref:hypothetical protein n=1 Tax=Acinetobacter sp. CFCC 10889 TaxID=1775557 RepID=UPI000DCF651C|nr:hypothetical protein [Acinetobacter sp. CFCC 10889]